MVFTYFFMLTQPFNHSTPWRWRQTVVILDETTPKGVELLYHRMDVIIINSFN